jgi:Flp pilus assembly protein TadG
MSFGQHISNTLSLFRPALLRIRANLNTLLAGDRPTSTIPFAPGELWSGRIYGGQSRFETRAQCASHFPAGQRGAQLYEFAVTLPAILLVFTGLLSFGVYLNKSIELTNSTSLAGQYLAISRLPAPATSDPCAVFVSAFQNVSPYLLPASLTYTFYFDSRTTTPYTQTFTAATSCPTAGTALTGMVQGGSVTTTVTYPCSIGVFGLNLAPGCILRSQVTEIIQ